MEDLWCFNEEAVARAMARSAIPVISAVGHEVDFTISDFVADARAPTPSAAAEMVVERKEEFEERLAAHALRLAGAARGAALRARHRLSVCAGSYVFREPGNMARAFRQRLDGSRVKMRNGVESLIASVRQRLDEGALRLAHVPAQSLAVGRESVKRLESQLRALNPLAVLDRGYSITRDRAGRVVRLAGDVTAGERVSTRVARGSFESEVVEIHDQES